MKVIVAPLNWGLGHSSRCVPIIQKLINENFTPVIASDGNSLEFLRKEFPEIEYIQLPTYGIKYHKFLKISLLFNLFKIKKAVSEEFKIISKYIDENSDVVGLISDNRFGVYSSKVPSVYITHETKVLSGVLTPFTSLYHAKIIHKFSECWIPDTFNSLLSG